MLPVGGERKGDRGEGVKGPEWVPIVKENAKTLWIRHPGDGRLVKVKKARVLAVREKGK